MLLFRSVFVSSPVALAFVAGLLPSAIAAPWWPMHYVLGEIPPDQASPLATTTQLGITSAIGTVSATVSSTSSSVIPGASNIAESLANASKGSDSSLDAATQQSSSATVVEHAGSTSVIVGCSVLALYLAF